MPEYILIPTPIRHPTFSEMELLIRRIGHDYLSDFSAIEGSLGLLEGEMKLSERKKWVKNASTSLQNATTISQALARLGTSKSHPKDFSLGELLREPQEYTARHFSLSLTVSAEENILPQVCHNDFNVLYMQLFNFLQNACDSYDGKNSPKAELGAELFHPSEQELHYLGRNAERYTVKDSLIRVWVKDEGKGIPPERLSTIFRPGVTTKPNGSGLGLSLVDYICDFVHGFAKVESEVGKGSTFSLYFAQNKKLV